jgi:hypothetical protein
MKLEQVIIHREFHLTLTENDLRTIYWGMTSDKIPKDKAVCKLISGMLGDSLFKKDANGKFYDADDVAK